MLAIVCEIGIAVTLALPIHEGAHALAARALGAQDVRIERAGWLGLRVRATFAEGAHRARALFLLAGALGNLAAAALAFAVLHAHLAAGIHALFAVLTLVPGRDTDGGRLLSLLDERR